MSEIRPGDLKRRILVNLKLWLTVHRRACLEVDMQCASVEDDEGLGEAVHFVVGLAVPDIGVQ